MRLGVLLSGLALLSAACARLPQPSSDRESTRTTDRRDSTATATTYKEHVRLTPVQLQGDVVPFETQLEVNHATGQLKPATYRSRGRRATVSLQVDAAGKVTGQCGCEAQQATIASLDRELTQARAEHRQEAKQEQKTEVITLPPVQLPYTTWYDWLARFVAIGLSAGLLILFLIHRLAPRKENG